MASEYDRSQKNMLSLLVDQLIESNLKTGRDIVAEDLSKSTV